MVNASPPGRQHRGRVPLECAMRDNIQVAVDAQVFVIPGGQPGIKVWQEVTLRSVLSDLIEEVLWPNE